MQSYSLNGYLNAVLRRHEKTLLVEGVTDQSVMTRLKREKSAELGYEPKGQIDISGLVEDHKTQGLGKKQAISVILNEVNNLPSNFSNRLKEKLGALCDREWDGLNIEMQLADPWEAPEQEVPYFVTTGHSVENYFFKLDGIESYLRQHFYAALDQNFFNVLRERFHSIIALAVTYSLAIRHAAAITRSMGVISNRHVLWIGGRYLVRDDLIADLENRGVVLPEGYLGLINHNVDIYLTSHAEVEPGRWLCHGHLGEDAIWACIANLCNEFGLEGELLKTVERGYKELRLNHAIDHLSRRPLNERAPLDGAIEWLVA